MYNLVVIFISGTYITIKCEVDVVVGCVVSCVHHCWIYRSIQNEASVSYICNEAAIFFQENVIIK